MRLVLLVAHNPEGRVQHRYVAKRIADVFPEELKAVIIATGIPRSKAQKIKRWWQRYTLPEIGSRILVQGLGKVQKKAQGQQDRYGAILFPGGEDGLMPRRDLLMEVPSHNGRQCLELLERLDADVVIVYGTLIIGRKVIAASKRIINLHTGLSPRYRGSDTIFWPLHNGEPEYVGVTVHRLEPGIDSGPILARGRPFIEPGDTEDALFARGVKLGADLLCSAVRREFEGVARPIVQKLEEGHEYRSVDRTLAAELKTRKLLRQGLISRRYEQWQEEF